MSAYPEFNNWNPMADDYFSTAFNSYDDAYSTEKNLYMLYIFKIPASLTQDEFEDICSGGKRKLKSCSLKKPLEDRISTIGFCTFESKEDAREALLSIDNKPPYHIRAKYANKKTREKEPISDNTSFSNYSSLPPRIGRGRGDIMSNALNSALESNKEKLSNSAQPNNSLPRGRGCSLGQTKIAPMKIVIEAGKRTSYEENGQSPYARQKSATKSDLPSLIPIPCSFCKKSCQLSCEVCKQPYCSSQCQEKDWLKHKDICKVFIANHEKLIPPPQELSDSEKKEKDPPHFVPKSVMNFASHGCTTNKVPTTLYNPKPNIIKAEEIEDVPLDLNSDIKVRICNANNPSCFWVQKETAIKIVTSMEKELSACVEKKTLQIDKGFVCSTSHNEKIVRVKVIEIISNCSKVELIDYGGIISVPITQLWYLPERFKVYPSQAICCNLVDSSENKKVEWSPEEISTFQCMNLDVCYKAHVYRHINKIYDISLYTDTGASVYSMIVLPSHSLSDPPNENIIVPGVMSICKTWQQDCKFNVIPMQLEADKFWGILSDGLKVPEKLAKIENELKDLKTEEVSLKIEEGEIAAALSPAYQSYFRCMVLQRLKNSFKVIYIDYGNKEVVNCLRKLPETLLKEPSYVVCLEKPPLLPAPDYQSLFETEKSVEVVFKSIKKDRIEFSVKQNNGDPLILPFFPWYHFLPKPIKKIEMKLPSSRLSSIESPDSEMSKQSCKKAETNLQLTKPSFIKSSTVSPNSTPIMKEKKIMVHFLPQASNFLSNGTRYSVSVTYLKNSQDSPELFVQFEKDKNDISSLCSQLNQHCCALSNNKYVPMKNEVICCKFSADNSWYRGQVVEKVNGGYSVFFIDYGNEDLVPENYIQPLPEKFALRKFSHSVCVKSIIPTKLPQKLQMKLYSDLWDMEVKDAKKCPTEVMLFQGEKSLIDLMNFDKHTKSSLKYQKLPANVQSEVLVSYQAENKLFLNQVKDLEAIRSLCEKLNSLKSNVAKSSEVNNVYCGLASDGLWYRVFVVKVLSPSSVRVHFVDFGNEEDISTSNLKDLPKELFCLPVYCISVIASNIVVFKLDLQKEYTVEVVDDKAEMQHVKFLNFQEKPKLPTISSMKTLSLPKNELVEITLCHFEEGIYYVQMITSQEDVKALVLKLQQASEFLDISDLPKQDDVICAKCSDGLWYRGSVREVSNKKICTIYFLDYGNLETVTLDNIKVLPTDLCSFPIFSVPVKISNTDVLQSLDDPTLPLKIKVVDGSEDNVQVVEIGTEPIQKEPIVETRLLSDLPVEVGISHRENDIYYVQKISDLEKLSEMWNSLQVIERKNIVPSIGNLVCATFQGDIYRGIIQEKCPNNKFKVFFVDYGNVDIVNIQDIFRIPSKYACEPMFSIAVRFVNTIPKLEVDSRHIVKNTGMCDKIHEVKYCKAYTVIEFSSMQTSTLSQEPVEVHFLSQEGEYYNVIKICDFSIKSELDDLLKNFSGQEIHHIPIVGEVLLVKSKDQSWYRGCVKEVQKTSGVCKMHLFDLGTVEEAPTTNMAYMPEEWKKYPMFSIKIALEKPNTNSILLTNLKVSVIARRDGGIPVVKILQQFRYSDMKHYFLPVNELRRVIFFHKEEDIYYLQDILSAVNYIEVQTEIAKCIHPLPHIPSEGEIVCAQSTLDGDWYRGCVKELLSNGQYKVHFIDFGNSENISKLNLKECSEKLVSYPVYSVAVKLSGSTNVEIGFEMEYTVIAEKESQNKVQTIKLVSDCEVHLDASTENSTKIENDTSHSVIKTDQNLNVSSSDKFYFNDCEPVPFPPGKQEVIIYYIHDFFVSCAPYNEQALLDTVNLLQEMKTFCDDLKSDTYNGNIPPKAGEMVLAKYEDDMWYRATVLEEKLPSYELLFVDYGNMNTTTLSSMRKMEKMFMNLNLQVHMCELEGFKYDEEKTVAVKNELQSFINKRLEANVAVSAESTITVNIPEITKRLVAKGLATAV